MIMTKDEQKKYLNDFVASQGMQAGISIAPLLDAIIDSIPAEPNGLRTLQLSPSSWVSDNSIYKYTVNDAEITNKDAVIINFPNNAHIATLDSAGFKHNSITVNNGSFVIYSELRPGAMLTMTYKAV